MISSYLADNSREVLEGLFEIRIKRSQNMLETGSIMKLVYKQLEGMFDTEENKQLSKLFIEYLKLEGKQMLQYTQADSKLHNISVKIAELLTNIDIKK